MPSSGVRKHTGTVPVLSLQEINLPDCLTSIRYLAFYNCRNLTSINIPDTVTSIGS